MLRSLSLTNFQKHQDLEIDFVHGLNLVVGNNWAGKTTIQRAVLYALFGTSAVPVKAASLVNQSAQTMEVELVFELADQLYTVRRGTKGALLRQDGTVLASGQTAVTAAMEALLNCSAKDFIAFQVARQNEAASILTLGSTKLNAHMESVCGVSLVDNAVQWLRARVLEAKGLADQAQLIEERLIHLREELPALEQAAQTATHAHDAQLADRNAAQEMVAYLSGEVRRLTEAVTLHSTHKRAREALQDLLNSLPDVLAPDPDEVQEVAQQLDHLKAQAAVFGSAKTARAQRLRDVVVAEQALADAKLSVPVDLPSIETIESELLIASNDVAQARSTWNMAVKERDSSACHACGRPFDDARDEASLEALVSAAQAALTAATEKESGLRHRLAQARTGIRAEEIFQAAMRRLLEARERLEETPEPEEVDAQALADLTAKSAQLTQQAQQFEERARVLAQWAALPDPGPDEGEALKETHKALEAWRKHANETENLLLRSEYDLKEARTALERADRESTELSERAKTMAAGMDKAKQRKQLVDVLVDNRESFMAGAWARLLSTASDFASAATQGAVTQLQREGDEFFFYEVADDAHDGERRPIELASGHQQAVLGVGIKLALTAAVGAAFDVVLLDEVSAGATDELSLMMTRALKEQTSQCLLISHRQADAALADCVIPV
jgi:DNA repair exonuclease SbcCD ATPase subunit